MIILAQYNICTKSIYPGSEHIVNKQNINDHYYYTNITRRNHYALRRYDDVSLTPR